MGWGLAPVAARPLWLVLGTVAVLLAAIDARTTWLPLVLTRIGWLGMAAATVVAGLLSWLSVGIDGAVQQVLRIVAGAVIVGALYAGVWLISRGGFGFGDVRFAPLVGAAAAAHSFSLLLAALVLGSLAGAGYGLVRLHPPAAVALPVRAGDPRRGLSGAGRECGGPDVERGRARTPRPRSARCRCGRRRRPRAR